MNGREYRFRLFMLGYQFYSSFGRSHTRLTDGEWAAWKKWMSDYCRPQNNAHGTCWTRQQRDLSRFTCNCILIVFSFTFHCFNMLLNYPIRLVHIVFTSASMRHGKEISLDEQLYKQSKFLRQLDFWVFRLSLGQRSCASTMMTIWCLFISILRAEHLTKQTVKQPQYFIKMMG